MSATKTQAFVLRTQDFRDTSLLVHFYTRDFGKINGIVKAIRDARARYGSTLEPFSLNEILFYRRRRGGDLHQVTQVELVDLFPAVRQDLERLAHASYFIQLVGELVEPEEPAPALFDLLKDALVFLAGGSSCKRSARIFEVKLMELLGFSPEVRQCVRCRSAEKSEAVFFSVAHGGILCRPCAEAGQVSNGRSGGTGPLIAVSRGTLHFIDHARRAPFPDLESVKVSQGVGVEVEKVLRRFVDYHLSKPLKSVMFMEKMGY